MVLTFIASRALSRRCFDCWNRVPVTFSTLRSAFAGTRIPSASSLSADDPTAKMIVFTSPDQGSRALAENSFRHDNLPFFWGYSSVGRASRSQ